MPLSANKSWYGNHVSYCLHVLASSFKLSTPFFSISSTSQLTPNSLGHHLMPITILALRFLMCNSTNWLHNCESIATTFRSNHHTCAVLNTILPSTFNAHQHMSKTIVLCGQLCLHMQIWRKTTIYNIWAQRVVYFTPTFPNSSFKLWLKAPLFQPHPKEHSSSQF
jgi:hypothetical protein